MQDNTSETLFPSSFDSEEEKQSKKYILDYAKTLWGESNSKGTSYSFDNRRDRYVNNRKYAEGLQSVEKFKQQFSTTGDTTYLNLDWGVETPAKTLLEAIRGQMINQPYKPQFMPVDSLSLTEYDREKEVMRAKMKIRDELAPLIEQGVIPEPKDVPEDDDELEIYMQTNFKLAQSMAMESITKAICEDNDIEYINNKTAKDLRDLKIAARRIKLDENKNIQIQYIDPVKLVTSYVERDDFKDAKHIGVVDDMTIEDLRVLADGQLSEDDLRDIAKSVAGRYDNPDWNSIQPRYYNNDFDRSRYNKFTVKVLDFEFFSTDKMKVTKVEASNGGYSTLIDEEPRNKKAQKKEKEVAVKNVYCGKHIIGTDYLFDYGLKEHIIRERLNGRYSTNTTLGFVVYAPDIYDMENKSTTETLIPFIDDFIRVQLKLQQVIAKAKPSGYAINVDAVAEALQGMGIANLTPLDARAITDQIGDVFFKELREDGTPLTQHASPVTPLPNGLDDTILRLVNYRNSILDNMKQSIGINDAVDGMQPDKKALVGVQKLAAAAHKNALRSLYNAYLKINEDTVRQVSMLAQQLIRKGINVDKFKNMVGEDVIEQLDVTRLTTADFAISIKMLPDEEEKAYIDQKVELALAGQPPLINLQDAFTIRRVADEDVDKAEALLGIRERKRRKERLEEQRAMSQENTQMQIQAAQAAEQAKMQTKQLETQLDVQKMDKEWAYKFEYLKREKEYDIQLKLIDYDGKEDLIEKAAEIEQGSIKKDDGESSYDKLDMPAASGTKMPAVTPNADPLRIR